MSISRDAIMKKGGHAKTPTSLRSDLKKMVGSYTHKSMDNEPSYKKLHARSHQIRVGEPRKLRKSEVDKETPFNARSLHDNRGHSAHNEPRLGYHENKIGLKRGGKACHADGGDAETTAAKRGGRMRRSEGGETPEKKRGGKIQHKFLGGIIDKIADYNPIAALATGRGFGGAMNSFGNAAGAVLPFLKDGGEAHRRGGRTRRAEGGEPEAKKSGGSLQGHKYGERELNMKRPGTRARHLEGYRAEGGKCDGGKMADGGQMSEAKRGGKIKKRSFGGFLSSHVSSPSSRPTNAAFWGLKKGGRAEGGDIDAQGEMARKRGGRTRHAEGGDADTEALKRGGPTHRAEGGEMECHGGRMSEGGDLKAKKGMWIQDMHMKKGKLHRELGIPQGEKIPGKKLTRAEHSRNPTIRKEANLAKTLKSFHPKNRR